MAPSKRVPKKTRPKVIAPSRRHRLIRRRTSRLPRNPGPFILFYLDLRKGKNYIGWDRVSMAVEAGKLWWKLPSDKRELYFKKYYKTSGTVDRRREYGVKKGHPRRRPRKAKNGGKRVSFSPEVIAKDEAKKRSLKKLRSRSKTRPPSGKSGNSSRSPSRAGKRQSRRSRTRWPRSTREDGTEVTPTSSKRKWRRSGSKTPGDDCRRSRSKQIRRNSPSKAPKSKAKAGVTSRRRKVSRSRSPGDRSRSKSRRKVKSSSKSRKGRSRSRSKASKSRSRSRRSGTRNERSKESGSKVKSGRTSRGRKRQRSRSMSRSPSRAKSPPSSGASRHPCQPRVPCTTTPGKAPPASKVKDLKGKEMSRKKDDNATRKVEDVNAKKDEAEVDDEIQWEYGPGNVTNCEGIPEVNVGDTEGVLEGVPTVEAVEEMEVVAEEVEDLEEVEVEDFLPLEFPFNIN